MTNYRIDRIGTHRNCTFIPLSLFAVSMWSNSAPMRVDAVDAVISHTADGRIVIERGK